MSITAHSFPPDPAVIVASPNSVVRQQLVEKLLLSRVPASEAIGGADALSKLEASECRLLLLDRKLPDLDAEELRNTIHSRFPGIDVLLLDEAGRPSPPHEWRSDDSSRLLQSISPSIAATPAITRHDGTKPVEVLPGMIGQSDAMRSVYHMARLIAKRNTPVLISGPTGTGKELVARAIHDLSPRATRPLITINCAAIPEALLEAELFGYQRGAFTGAVQSHLGRIHSAHGGTLFLDEIGELPLGTQAKLLRFIEYGEIQRLGSSETSRVDVRIVAATNADLAGLTERKLFREDLYYRLSVFPIPLPALANRDGDVPLLANHFLRKFGGRNARLSPEALSVLESYSWPGNVRELQHVIERGLILAEDGTVLSEHLAIERR